MPSARLSDLDLLATLVAFDTTSHRDQSAICDFIASYLDDVARIERHTYEDGAKVNLICSIGPSREAAPPRAGLVLSGHVDCVPALEPDWQTDPFELADFGDRVVARGSCDMKGFVALAMNTLRDLADDPPTVPVVLLLTSDEELGSRGAQVFAREWPDAAQLPRAVLVGEPTSLRVVRMHKGHLKLRVSITGRPGHSGFPQRGANAIEPLADVIGALRSMREAMLSERTEASPKFDEVPFAVLNQALVRGGDAENIIPAQVTLDVGVRLLPGQTTEEFLPRFQATLEAVPLPEGISLDWVVTNDSPPMLTDAAAPLAGALSRFRDQPDFDGVSYSTDGGTLNRLGLECVVWGPGDISVAHRANEFMPKDEYAEGGRQLRAFAHTFLSEQSA